MTTKSMKALESNNTTFAVMLPFIFGIIRDGTEHMAKTGKLAHQDRIQSYPAKADNKSIR